jgi:hypothetical protein
MNALFFKVLIGAAALPGLWLAANASETASEEIAVRDSARIATVHAEGAQTYVCKQKSEDSPSQPRALVWEFREPSATLSSNGMSIGRHYAGPNWDYFDGSGVKGKVVASAQEAAQPETIFLWLSSRSSEHRGDGASWHQRRQLSSASTPKAGSRSGSFERTKLRERTERS